MYWILIVCLLTNSVIATLDPKQLPIVKKKLFVPPLDEIAQVLKNGLENNYDKVRVEVVDCPDLTQPPFTLANVGLNGNPRIVDFGGTLYGRLAVTNPRIYDFINLPALVDLNTTFIIGASAGSIKVFGSNSECVVDINVGKDKINQQTRLAIYVDDKKWYVQKDMPKNETRFTTLANYFVSEGKPGPVLKVHVQKRIGTNNFPESIKNSLTDHYRDKVIGLGGTFLLKTGKVKQHLMPNIPPTPYSVEGGVFNWFQYFTMSAPIIAVGRIVTHEYGLHLLDYHFHSFSNHSDSGHYYIDKSPEIAEYEGYFNVAEFVYSIDNPFIKEKGTA